MGTTTSDDKYRRAVETVAANCGGRARAVLTAGDGRFPPAGVTDLAGRSPEYQRHVLARAEAGDPRPLKRIAASLLVYETVAFGEVLTRLGRAAGGVRKEARLLDRAAGTGRPPDRLADRLLTLDLIADAAGRLLDLLASLPVAGPTRRRATARVRPGAAAGEVTAGLNAAAALGLVSKNVHDVSELRPAHLPTPDQNGRAVGAARDLHQAAATARDAARRAFGPADGACRVRPRGRPILRVVTHARPDGDAVAAAWLAERFLLAGDPVEVLLVPRERVLGAYRAGDCLVDVGNTHDPENLFFDHKPPAFADRHDACAARLVWDRLVELGRPVERLRPLVDVVFAGDSARARSGFQEEYAESKRAGFHKALADAKAENGTDARVYTAVRKWLDAQHRRLLASGR